MFLFFRHPEKQTAARPWGVGKQKKSSPGGLPPRMSGEDPDNESVVGIRDKVGGHAQSFLLA